MTRKVILIVAALGLGVAFLATPTPAEAQECGSCFNGFWQHAIPANGGGARSCGDQGCHSEYWLGYCDQHDLCGTAPEPEPETEIALLSDIQAVVEASQNSDPIKIAELLKQNETMFNLNRDRRAVQVLNPCGQVLAHIPLGEVLFGAVQVITNN